MRIFAAILLVLLTFATVSARAQEPLWAAVSTEVDEFLDGSGFMQRHVLRLDPPDFSWPGSIFFDPGMIIGVDTGLDAYHYGNHRNGAASAGYGQHYFATEVDFMYRDTLYQDEDLMMYDEFTGALTEVFDVKDILGDDYGLDAITSPDTGIWAFSTEVDHFELTDGLDGIDNFFGFTDGDILITDGTDLLDVIYLEPVFGRNVGLDALQFWGEEWDGNDHYTHWLISTEVDGWFINGDDESPLPTGPDFRDEDILVLRVRNGEVEGVELSEWRGVDAFGRDVGLDALYAEPIPEPATMLVAVLGLAVFGLRRLKRP